MSATEQYHWSELSNIPEAPGIYAWYFQPFIPDYDINKAITTIEALTKEGKTPEALSVASSFLNDQLLHYFKELPYYAKITGQLKPSYEGLLEQRTSNSESLLARIIENPTRIKGLKKILEFSAPHFASPIYIGMSNNLRSRINQHRVLIEKYREQFFSITQFNEVDDCEAGFARQIAQRRIPPERLIVMTKINHSEESIHVDAENILNRIYYPILGRN